MLMTKYHSVNHSDRNGETSQTLNKSKALKMNLHLITKHQGRKTFSQEVQGSSGTFSPPLKDVYRSTNSGLNLHQKFLARNLCWTRRWFLPERGSGNLAMNPLELIAASHTPNQRYPTFVKHLFQENKVRKKLFVLICPEGQLVFGPSPPSLSVPNHLSQAPRTLFRVSLWIVIPGSTGKNLGI